MKHQHQPHERSSLSLTFDDGPRPSTTGRLLAILNERNVKATFFVVGHQVRKHPEIVGEIISSGHEIGNHTYSHPFLPKLSDEAFREEVRRTQDAIFFAASTVPRWFRPPYGALIPTQHGLLTEMGLHSVLWNVDTQDWSRPGADQITDRIVRQARSNSIILCHDLYSQTAEALPDAIDCLLGRGFCFSTITQLKSN